jgi:ring-1,2-phenylacetyl-CoA epoxidase subunit PaaC
MIGQARNFYQYAAKIKNKLNAEANSASLQETEDSLAYLRNNKDFKNCILTELPNGDWGFTILKVFFFANFQFILFEKLKQSSDHSISAVAEKSIKETAYHLRWSAEWVIRLGDGTMESKQRMLNALEEVQNCIEELFYVTDYEDVCAKFGIGVDPFTLKDKWLVKVHEVLEEATLPKLNLISRPGEMIGKEGNHTENLEHILAEMQMLQRTYPGNEW